MLRNSLENLIKKIGLEVYITIKGHPCWLLMQFRNSNKELCDGYKTLVFQEAAKNGILFRGTFVFSLSHTQKEVDKTINVFEKIFKTYKKAIEVKDYKRFLVGDPVKPVFRKYN